MTVGEKIRQLRKERNLTQKQLGELAGIAEPTIRRYELGKLNPKYETIVKIATALRTSTGVILGGGSQIKYKVIQWKSRKDAHLEMNIDAELLERIQSLADFDGLSLEDEVEKLLFEYSDIVLEDVVPCDQQKTPQD